MEYLQIKTALLEEFLEKNSKFIQYKEYTDNGIVYFAITARDVNTFFWIGVSYGGFLTSKSINK